MIYICPYDTRKMSSDKCMFRQLINLSNINIFLLSRREFNKYEKGRDRIRSPLYQLLYCYFTESGSATAQKAGFGLPFPSNSNGN